MKVFLRNFGKQGITGLVAALVAFVTVAAPSAGFHSWFHEEIAACDHGSRQPAPDPASEDPSQHNHGLLTLLSSGQFALLADIHVTETKLEPSACVRLLHPPDVLPLEIYGLLPGRGPPVLA